MNEEVKNNENKKKQKVAILIGLVTLLIAVLGATYAYFQISTNNESSNTTITGKTPPKSLVTLKPGADNLHLNISASDMSYENRTKEYYGTDGEDPYVGTEELGTKTIASVELTGGEVTTKYSCTAKLTVSKVTEEENADTMVEVLQLGDMILQFKGNIISEKLDLSELKENTPKEYNLNFKITGNKVENIQAYIKLLNKEEQQNYLAGKKLNIDISTSELKCDIAEPETIDKLRNNDSQKYLSEDLQGGMYRYQASPVDETGTAQMINWICFGTTDKEQCTNEDTGIDKYMYRIIGITEEGQMYLIKETFLKEGTQKEFAWNDKYSTSSSDSFYCDDGLCPEWNTSLLFKRINGTSNGTQAGDGSTLNKEWTDIFVDSSEYEYLKSGDSINGTKDNKGSKWYQLIADHEWMYGDTNVETESVIYNGRNMYDIETGQTETTHYVDSMLVAEQYRWPAENKVTAKISLMYIHDYLYSYYDGSTEESRGNPGGESAAKNGWLHFQKDGYNSSTYVECFSTRNGVLGGTSMPTNHYVLARCVDGSGRVFGTPLGVVSSLRPVFFLSSAAKIKDGVGTKANPYILDVEE